MQITINLTEEQRQDLLKQLANKDAIKQDSQSQLSNYGSKYLTVPGLQELAKTEFQQFSIQEKTIEQIINKIKNKTLSINPNIDKLFLNANAKAIANTLCNGNSRILVADNFLAANNKEPLPFEEAYLKALNGNGFFANTLSSCNSDIYRALLTGIIEYKIIIEKNQSNYKSFIVNHPNKLIRAWTVSEKNQNDTHATLLFYEPNNIPGTLSCIDTASTSRNIIISIENLTHLHGRKIEHLEILQS